MNDDDRELITPHAGLARRAEHAGAQLAVGDVAPCAMLCWGRGLFERAVKYTHAESTGKRAAEAELYRGEWGGVSVTLVAPGIGAPATALVADKLHAAGARVIVGVGFAGGVSPLLTPGTVVVVEEALSDEGTSKHYVGTGVALEADARLLEGLKTGMGHEFVRHQCGKAWTTDAVYRETVAKARAFRALGAHAVEMESAALLAVAKRRGFAAGALLTVTDMLCRFAPLDAASVDGLVWEWQPAPAGSVEGPAGAMLRGAFGGLTGFTQP